MISLDDDLLEELGLGSLPAAERKPFLQHVYDTLEIRVGQALTSKLTSDQLAEFEAVIDTGDEAGPLQWLTETVPTYKQTVNEEFELLKQEIRMSADEILAAAPADQT